MSRAQVFRWHKTFLDGRESVEDLARQEKEENVAKMRALVMSARRVTE